MELRVRRGWRSGMEVGSGTGTGARIDEDRPVEVVLYVGAGGGPVGVLHPGFGERNYQEGPREVLTQIEDIRELKAFYESAVQEADPLRSAAVPF